MAYYPIYGSKDRICLVDSSELPRIPRECLKAYKYSYHKIKKKKPPNIIPQKK